MSEEEKTMDRNNWLMGILGVIVSFAVTVLIYRYLAILQEQQIQMAAEGLPNKPGSDIDDKNVVKEGTPSEPDDLTLVEGIGPKTSSALQDAGITTYAQLAVTDQDTVKQVLNQAGVRIAVSDTWMEQAAFAAAGDWDALTELKNELKAGRRSS